MTQPIGSAQGYFGIANQAAWGSSLPPAKFSYYKNISPDYKVAIEAVREGGGLQDNIWAWKKSADFDGNFDIYARPDIAGAVFSYFLGADAITGAADPYLHTITPAGTGVPVSLEFEYSGMEYVRIADALLNSLSFSADTGKPASLKVGWTGRDIEFVTSATPAYETDRPLIFWDATFTVDGTAEENTINKFSVDAKCKTIDDIRTASPIRDAIARADRDITAKWSMVVYDKDKMRKVLTGATDGTTIGNPPVTGSLVITLTEESATPAREIKVTLANLVYSIPKMSDLDDDNKAVELDITATALKGSATDIMKVEIQNAMATGYLA